MSVKQNCTFKTFKKENISSCFKVFYLILKAFTEDDIALLF